MDININDIDKLVEEMLKKTDTFEPAVISEEIIKSFSNETNEEKKDTRYNYSAVYLEEVVKNPDEYIIPECQPACKTLWDKNIETYMVSNYDDNCLYVLLNNLSKENEDIIKELIKTDDRYYFSEFRNTYGISVKGMTVESANELLNLTNVFKMQDTKRYQSSQQFLSNYNHFGIPSELIEYMPDSLKVQNLTLEEALKEAGKTSLYIQEEDRVYENSMYLKWHQRYLAHLQNSINEKLKRTK